MNESDLKKYLLKGGLSLSAAEVLAYFLSSKKAEFLATLKQYANTSPYTLNDVSICLHTKHYKYGDYVEILNPYAEDEFALIEFNHFKEVTATLLDGEEIDNVQLLSGIPSDRSDYEESRSNW